MNQLHIFINIIYKIFYYFMKKLEGVRAIGLIEDLSYEDRENVG